MTVPIVPGQPPEEPHPTVPYAYYPPQPQPVYYPNPPQAPTINPGRVAGNTLVVVLTLVGIFCVLPMLACGLMAALGAFTSPGVVNGP